MVRQVPISEYQRPSIPGWRLVSMLELFDADLSKKVIRASRLKKPPGLQILHAYGNGQINLPESAYRNATVTHLH